jgi:hypothetical protein
MTQIHPPAHKREGAKTQRRKEADAEPEMRSRLLAAERQAIESPAAGEKPDDSGYKHPSSPVFSPADVPRARRFCLSSLLFMGEGACLSHLLNKEERWRGLRF